MRLINIKTLEIKDFTSDIPYYAILSHRWGDQEVTFQDYQRWWLLYEAGENLCDSFKDFLHSQPSAGLHKILSFCKEVLRMDKEGISQLWPIEDNSEFYREFAEKKPPNYSEIGWVWVDTVCINKQSSAELSEDINSMWDYYTHAIYCVAYLSDVDSDSEEGDGVAVFGKGNWNKSKWFERGWTLQELLAPRRLAFYSASWVDLGWTCDDKTRFAAAERTAIDEQYLRTEFRDDIFSASVAKRLSWASNRKTTKPEDLSYCLMGLLEVNLPLLYGEGPLRAFRRLQEEIVRQSNDESIFAWQPQCRLAHLPHGALATSPKDFSRCGNIRAANLVSRQPYAVTNMGLQFMSPAIEIPHGNAHSTFVMKLNCVRFTKKVDANNYPIPVSCLLTLWGPSTSGRTFYRDFKGEDAFQEATTKQPAKEHGPEPYKIEHESKRFIIPLKASGGFPGISLKMLEEAKPMSDMVPYPNCVGAFTSSFAMKPEIQGLKGYHLRD